MQASDTMSWVRLSRQVYWLASGHRDVSAIAQLLHKAVSLVEDIALQLYDEGYLLIRRERKVLTMNIPLLRQSFDMIAPHKEIFAQRFYERLFFDYPETRQLFAQTDMRRQGGSLVATLAVVITGAERGENIGAVVQALGARHGRYGAKTEHYPLVGAVLIATFREFLKERFTDAMEQSWVEAYEIIAEKMKEGAQSATSLINTSYASVGTDQWQNITLNNKQETAWQARLSPTILPLMTANICIGCLESVWSAAVARQVPQARFCKDLTNDLLQVWIKWCFHVFPFLFQS
jgi:hemoglobin-like flavoprotein